MRIYDVRCEQCGWKSPLPVDAKVASILRDQMCRSCSAAGRPHRFTVTERIVVGPTQFFPAKE